MTAPIHGPHYDHQFNRRRIVLNAAATLICAPSIVRAANLMPVRGLILPIESAPYAGFVERLRYDFLERALRVGWDDRRHGPIVGGISEAQARRSVAYARIQGWLPNVAEGFLMSKHQSDRSTAD